MRRPMVAGNWKMCGDRSVNESLVAGVLGGVGDDLAVDVVICPPAVYLSQVAAQIKGSELALAGQDCAFAAQGAYTGEISAGMLADVGCQYVIIGHSERRQHFGETDALVVEKFKLIQSNGLVPILCVGETLEQRESGLANDVVCGQLMAVVDAVGVDAFLSAVVAYEPVWAIGTGLTATPEQAQEMHAYIRALVASKGGRVAEELRVLYGGSVKPENARKLFSQADIDGGLVGGASLEAEKFVAIVKAVI
ncbi:MAG: triose-phosphate isomerase [Gammaproteobacteria bacterium]|nr:MAG: triose-phosphate isomerase [Gammaproteobacteria bacterium]